MYVCIYVCIYVCVYVCINVQIIKHNPAEGDAEGEVDIQLPFDITHHSLCKTYMGGKLVKLLNVSIQVICICMICYVRFY